MRSENLSSAGILEVNFYYFLNKKQLHFSDFVAVSAAPEEQIILRLNSWNLKFYAMLLYKRCNWTKYDRIVQKLKNWELLSFLVCTSGWVEKETYYWSMERLRSTPPPLISSPCHFIPGKTHLQKPRPIKDKNSFEAIFITTAPKIKNSRSTFTTFYTDPPSFLPSPMILFACVLSLLCT